MPLVVMAVMDGVGAQPFPVAFTAYPWLQLKPEDEHVADGGHGVHGSLDAVDL